MVVNLFRITSAFAPASPSTITPRPASTFLSSTSFTAMVASTCYSINPITTSGMFACSSFNKIRGHMVVELSDLDNEVLVKLVGGDLVQTVVAHDVIGRLMIQCARPRQPGLAQIWEDILGFENCEFYIKRWPQLDGMQFEDVLISFPDAIPCGVKVASYGGKIVLNPEDSYVLQEGDEVLVIAEDDDTYSPAALPTVLTFSLEHIDFK